MLPRNFFFGLYSSFAWGCLCIAFCDLEQKRLRGRAGAAPRTPMVKMGPMRAWHAGTDQEGGPLS